MAERRSPPASKTDDRRFRFRVKFRRPDTGIFPARGLHDWLTERVGLKGYAIHPVDWNQIGETLAVYFDDPLLFLDLVAYLDELTNGKPWEPQTNRFRK